MALQSMSGSIDLQRYQMIWNNNVRSITEKGFLHPQLHNSIIIRDLQSHESIIEGTKLLQVLSKQQLRGKESCHVCVTGQDGSGRSTILAGLKHDLTTVPTRSLNCDIDVIISVSCGFRRFPSDGRQTVSNKIFDDIGDSDIQFLVQCPETTGYQNDKSHPDEFARRTANWIVKYPSKVCFIFDDIDRILLGAITREENQTRETLIEILSGQKYPGCFVVSSCHEDNMNSLNAIGIDVDRSYHVQGLTVDAVQAIVSQFPSDEQSLYETIFSKMTPYSTALCENPMILLYVLHAIKYDSEKILMGKAGIFMQLLSAIKRRNLIEDFRKFMNACYDARRDGRSTFTVEDFAKHGLTSSDTKRFELDSLFLTKTIEIGGQILMAFGHPIILDGFTALYLYDCDRSRLKDEYEAAVDNENFHGAWQILSGLFADDEITEMAFDLIDPDCEKRAELLTDHYYKKRYIIGFSEILIRRWLDSAKTIDVQLRALHLFAESKCLLGDSVIDEFDDLSMIPSNSIKLNRADASALSSCIRARGRVAQLKFDGCLISSHFLKALHEQIWNVEDVVKVNCTTFRQLRRVPTDEDIQSLSHFLQNVSEYCDCTGWEFDENELRTIQRALNNIKNPKLKVQINDGEILASQSTWTDVTESTIRNTGDTITFRSYRFQFPYDDSLPNECQVSLRVSNQAPEHSAEYIPITPAVSVYLDGDPKKSITINLVTYQKYDENSIAEIFHCEDGFDAWSLVKKAAMKKLLKFECKASGTIRAFYKFVRQSTNICISGFIWAKNDKIVVTFHQYHPSFEMDVEATMTQNGYSHLCRFEPIDMKITNDVTVNMKILTSDDQASFDGQNNVLSRFTLTKRFLRTGSIFVSRIYRLRSRQTGDYPINVMYVVSSNDGQTANNVDIISHRVIFKTKSVLDAERSIQEVFENEVLSRFSDSVQFRRFASSLDGFGIHIPELKNLFKVPAVREQESAMFEYWKSVNENSATANNLHKLVVRYSKREELLEGLKQKESDEAFNEIFARLIDPKERIEFFTSSNGMRIPAKFLDSTVGEDLTEITPSQQSLIFNKWKQLQGCNGSVDEVRQMVDRYQKQRHEDCFERIYSQFKGFEEWVEFLTSREGLNLPKSYVAGYEHQEQSLASFREWIHLRGKNVSPKYVRDKVARYFTRKRERQELHEELDNLILLPRFCGDREWLNFARSPEGLNLPQHVIEDVITEPKNVGLVNRRKLLDKFVEIAGAVKAKTRISSLRAKGVKENVRKAPTQCKTVSVGTDGCVIEVGGCFVSFPAGCFSEAQTITIAAEIDNKKWPEGKEAITPTLYVDAKKLRKSATVKLHTWCPHENGNEVVDLMHYNERFKKWENIAALTVENSRFVEFKTRHFSPWVTTLRNIFNQSYMILPIIFFKDKEFVVAMVLDTHLAKTQLLNDMKQDLGDDVGMRKLSLQPCKRNQKIQMCMTCDNHTHGFRFVESGLLTPDIRKIVKYATSSFRRCHLRGDEPMSNIEFTIRVELKDGERKLRSPDCFPYKIDSGYADMNVGVIQISEAVTHLNISGNNIGKIEINNSPQDHTPSGELISTMQAKEAFKCISRVPFASKSVDVGNTGCDIEVGGCVVTFPAGAFSEMQTVIVSTEIDVSKWPENIEAISPTVYITAERLQKRASVKLHTWCSGGMENQEIDLMRYDERSETWSYMKTLSVDNSGYVEFQTRHFSSWIAALSNPINPTYVIRPIIYFKEIHFVVAIVRDTLLAKAHLMEKMKEEYGCDVKNRQLPPLECKKNLTIRSDVECLIPEQGFQFEPTGSFTHAIRDIIKHSAPNVRCFQLRPESSATSNVNLTIQVQLKDGTRLLQPQDCFLHNIHYAGSDQSNADL